MRIFNPFASEELGKAAPACPGLAGSVQITCFNVSFQHRVQQRCLSDLLTYSTEQMFPFLVWSDASDVQTEIRKGKAYRVSCLSEAPICQFLTGRTKGRENQTPDQKVLRSCCSLSAWCCKQNPQASVLAKD